VLAAVWVEIESSGIRNVAAGIVRNNGDVIANLVLVGITLGWNKRVAY
jgi:DNA-binding IclR family transcriptional regulator